MKAEITPELITNIAKDSSDFDQFIYQIRKFNIPDGEGGSISPTALVKILHLSYDRDKNVKMAQKFYNDVKKANVKQMRGATEFEYVINENSRAENKAIALKFFNPKDQRPSTEVYRKLQDFINKNLQGKGNIVGGTVDNPYKYPDRDFYTMYWSSYFNYPENARRSKYEKEFHAAVKKIIDFYISEQLDADLEEIKENQPEPEPSFLQKIGSSIIHAFDSPKKPDNMSTQPETTNQKPGTTNSEAMNAHLSEPTVTNNATPEDNTYIPASEACDTLDTTAPALLRYEMMKAVETIDRRVNGVDEYVADKLGFTQEKCTLEEKQHGIKCLCSAFGAEQIDAVAVSIYNIENRHESTIIGDMTGIGKGRVAAGVMEYARRVGAVPIFFTEKPNLFSDIMRDLIAIGSDDGIPLEFLTTEKKFRKKVITKKAIAEARESAIEDGMDPDEAVEQLWTESEEGGIEIPVYIPNKNYKEQLVGKRQFVPFIINAPDTRTAVQDEDGNILYRPLPVGPARTEAITKNGLPKGFDGIFLTYSQIAGKKATVKRDFLMSLAKNAIIVMDESHNAAGESNTGKFLKELLAESKGAIFLSATFAKRPDNMPIYAAKTVVQEAQLSDADLVQAIKNGGVALQEIISSQLTREGEHLRRERTYEGIEVNYMYLDESQLEGNNPHPEFNLKEKHRAMADRATALLRDIMEFQELYVKPAIELMNQKFQARLTKGTEEGGISNVPVFNGIFNLISQLLFSIKCEAVAMHAIERLKEGKKPIIAFASTMESFLNNLTNDEGQKLRDGEVIVDDFSHVFKRRLKNCMKYTTTNPDGTTFVSFLDPEQMGNEFNGAYNRLMNKITSTTVGLSISPIDVLYHHIQNAGFTVEEVTGRNKRLKINGDGTAIYTSRAFRNAKDSFRMFNDNEIDCLMINRAGSTGASAHAIVTKKVPLEKVKQRVMIILQAELDINQEVQKRGRINRTNQQFKPIYDYVISAIPAEERFMMMLQKKLKSLDANTTSNQKQSSKLLDTRDFLNKYGDKYVTDWLVHHMQINNTIGDPLKDLAKKVAENGEDNVPVEPDTAHRISGRIAILPTVQQTMFYEEVNSTYEDSVALLRQSGEYDLEVEYLKLDAELESKQIVAVGTETGSIFSRHAILEKCTVNNLSKPYKADEVRAMVDQTLSDADGKRITSEQYNENLKEDIKAFSKATIEKDALDIKADTQRKLDAFRNAPAFKMALEKEKSLSEQIIEENKEVFGVDVDPAFNNLLQNIDEAPKKRTPIITQAEIDKQVAEKEKELIADEQTRLFESEAAERNLMNVKLGAIDFFRVGKVVAYPTYIHAGDVHAAETQWVKGIFVGFQISKNQKNLYVMSNIKLRFALAGTQRYRVVPLSKADIIMGCRDLTRTSILHTESYEYVMKQWNTETKKASADRITQYIVTGNILKVMGSEPFGRGKLISFTTAKGGIKKGILMPQEFDPAGKKKLNGADEAAIRITVPIIQCLPMMEKTEVDMNPLKTSLEIVITKKHNPNYNRSYNINRGQEPIIYEVMMPSRKDFMKYYAEDRVLVALMKNQFNKIATNMRGELPENKIGNLLQYLQDQYQATASLSKAQFDTYVMPNLTVTDYEDEETALPKTEKILDDMQQLDREGAKMAEEREKQKAVEEAAKTDKPVDLDAEKAIADLQAQAELTAKRTAISKKFVKLNTLLEAELGV